MSARRSRIRFDHNAPPPPPPPPQDEVLVLVNRDGWRGDLRSSEVELPEVYGSMAWPPEVERRRGDMQP